MIADVFYICVVVFVIVGSAADIDFAVVCDKGYRVSAIRRTKTYYSTLGALAVDCEQVASAESTSCAPQQNVPKCTGLLEGCTDNSWLGGFHAFLLENTTQATVLDPICCSSPAVTIDPAACINDQLNTGTHDFSHSIVADLVRPIDIHLFWKNFGLQVYRGWQCWHQYDANRTLVDLLWKTEICPFVSKEYPVVTRRTDCEECACQCGVEQCANGMEPIRVIHKKNLSPCGCDCTCSFKCLNFSK